MIYIFGYGSLVNTKKLASFLDVNSLPEETHFTYLNDWRRSWNVAMENIVNLPNYKYYVSESTNKRENIYVSFLNIEESTNSRIYGILFPIKESDLQKIDSRERNYNRVNITTSFDHLESSDVIYTYIGKEEGIQRYEEGLLNKNVYVQTEYYQMIENCYRDLGKKYYTEFMDSFENRPDLRALKRVRTD